MALMMLLMVITPLSNTSCINDINFEWCSELIMWIRDDEQWVAIKL